MATEDSNTWSQEPYADRLECEYPGEEYSWLAKILREGHHEGTHSPYPEDCTLYVVDHEGDQVATNEYNFSRKSDPDLRLVGSLTKQLPERATRIIVLSHGSLYNLNFSYIDAMAPVLNLEPDFLLLHFNRARGPFGLQLHFLRIHKPCNSYFHIVGSRKSRSPNQYYLLPDVE